VSISAGAVTNSIDINALPEQIGCFTIFVLLQMCAEGEEERDPKGLKGLVGASGFEPPTSWSRTRRSSQAEPRPEVCTCTSVASLARQLRFGGDELEVHDQVLACVVDTDLLYGRSDVTVLGQQFEIDVHGKIPEDVFAIVLSGKLHDTGRFGVLQLYDGIGLRVVGGVLHRSINGPGVGFLLVFDAVVF
jgi:hypothetical protein